ncbi:MAG: HAD-IIIC family phosphatase [Candidatus Marinimicrobia bacterium]|nr:HAD-IIIC family phosphatase [Candidatus Neomarinimicrobiota bacterium]
MKKTQIITLSNFNIQNFNSLISQDQSRPLLEVTATEYGQVFQYLLNPQDPVWNREYDCGIVWTLPELVSPTFGELREYKKVEPAAIRSEVEKFAKALLSLKDRIDTIFIPSWVLNPGVNGLGLLDLTSEMGFKRTVMQMNMTLTEFFKNEEGFYILDSERWVFEHGKESFNEALWYMAKVPYTNRVFQSAVKTLKSGLRAINVQSKKIVLVDLDNTLWGGIVGEDGWKNLKIGGHDPVGEAYVSFQNTLKSLTNRGILLGIVSKNSEDIALEAINRHPEMVLSEDDFAGWRINWNDKAQNIAELMNELNLGMDSAVFIDDNPYERGRVQETLQEVFVPEWPDDPFLYKKTLDRLDCFDTPTLTGEDRERAKMYIAEKRRDSTKNKVENLDEWLKSLNIEVKVEIPDDSNFPRIIQLFNKTNQMNMRTRRMTRNELEEWLNPDNRRLFAFRVSDRFGDSGLTGILTLNRESDTVQITDFILSCRVMGRKIEETMVAVAVGSARETGADWIEAAYEPTDKNQPCLEFWKRSGFETGQNQYRFRWNLEEEYPLPEHIQVIE